ncbi:MAG: peptidoglycan recognition protein family protein [Firmicutes bacterium]|nr:peptidoglycan recognition protein family protein [Bacillota bacterium]
MVVKDVVDQLPRHPSKQYRTRALGDIARVVIHHSATNGGTPESLARYHVNKRGWPGIGYHYVIASDGTVYKTNYATTVSWHAGSSANWDSIGACMIGDFTKHEVPQVQLASTLELVQELMRAYSIPVSGVVGHSEVPEAATLCPGDAVDMRAIRLTLREGS